MNIVDCRSVDIWIFQSRYIVDISEYLLIVEYTFIFETEWDHYLSGGKHDSVLLRGVWWEREGGSVNLCQTTSKISAML